jgi:hypothetical protein
MQANEELQALLQYHRDARRGSTLHNILTEVIGTVQRYQGKIRFAYAHQGSTVCRYNVRNNKPKGYIVNTVQGRLGTLLHELIHVCVNEAYGRDFVVYRADLTDAQRRRVPGREYRTVNGRDGFPTNELTRQERYRSRNLDAERERRILQLVQLAEQDRSLQRTNRATEVANQLRWAGATGIHKEYDTYITQVFFWCHEMRRHRRNPLPTRFFRETFYTTLEQAVAEAYNNRQISFNRRVNRNNRNRN